MWVVRVGEGVRKRRYERNVKVWGVGGREGVGGIWFGGGEVGEERVGEERIMELGEWGRVRVIREGRKGVDVVNGVWVGRRGRRL